MAMYGLFGHKCRAHISDQIPNDVISREVKKMLNNK